MRAQTIAYAAVALTVSGCNGGTTPQSGSSSPPSVTVTAESPPAPSTSASGEPSDNGPSKPLNVLLLTIDSLRADMPWQGYKKKIAPHLTKLADESVVYTRAYSISSYTAKSVGGLLSGRFPSTLYRGPTFFTKYSQANLFFPEILQNAGIVTLAGHAHGYFDRGKNLRQGFDVWKITPGIGWNATTDESVTSQDMTPMAVEMLAKHASTKKNFFMWLHYMDPHDQYKLHKECPDFGRRARSLYDNEVCYTDIWVRKLLDYCEKQPWWKDTVLIISSDHGEAFGEHKMWKHAFALWEVLTHVPLIIKVPGGKPRRIAARRSHIDLAPTILELLGHDPHKDFAGTSMVRELYGLEEPSDREPILLELPADTYNPPTRATIKGDYKLIEDPGNKFHLYDLSKDPGEKRNLVDSPAHKAKLQEMKALHQASWAKHRYMAPWGGRKLVGGKKANGPFGPKGWKSADKPP